MNSSSTAKVSNSTHSKGKGKGGTFSGAESRPFIVEKTVTPSFVLSGAQPKVEIKGDKSISDSFLIMMGQPGDSHLQSVTVSRPIGNTHFGRDEYVGTYTPSVPDVTQSAALDMQLASELVNQESYEYFSSKRSGIFEHLVMDKNAKKDSIMYNSKYMKNVAHELAGVPADSLVFESNKIGPIEKVPYLTYVNNHVEKWDEHAWDSESQMYTEPPGKCHVYTSIAEKIAITAGVSTSRNMIKKLAMDQMSADKKNSTEYIEYLEEKSVYEALNKKKKKSAKVPKAPKFVFGWTDYLPDSLAKAEHRRSQWITENRDEVVIQLTHDGKLNTTANRLTRVEQSAISPFRGKSPQACIEKLLGVLLHGDVFNEPEMVIAPLDAPVKDVKKHKKPKKVIESAPGEEEDD